MKTSLPLPALKFYEALSHHSSSSLWVFIFLSFEISGTSKGVSLPMSSPNSESDYDSSSSSDDPSSLTQNILDLNDIQGGDSLSSIEMTQSMFQIIIVHVPIIVAATMMRKKRPHGGSTPGRCYIPRDRKSRHDLIINDYFKGKYLKYKPKQFRQRFRMDVNLFNRILLEIEIFDDYFTQKIDAVGNYGLSTLQKMIAAIRMLAYVCAADLLDEYLQIGESTSVESLKHFCEAVIRVFEEWYLRKPNEADITRLLQKERIKVFQACSVVLIVCIGTGRTALQYGMVHTLMVSKWFLHSF